MNKSIWIFGIFVVLNNLYWISRINSSPPDQITYVTPAENQKLNTQKTIKATTAKLGANIQKSTTATPPVQQAAHSTTMPEQPLVTNSELSGESRDWLENLHIEKEIFDLDSKENKLALIEKLTPQGNDLVFIQGIMASAENEDIKVAALQKLQYQKHYGAINTAIQALNSKSLAVSLTALEVLKSTKDISLIPELQQFSKIHDNDNIRHEITKVISALESSVSMAMDNSME